MPGHSPSPAPKATRRRGPSLRNQPAPGAFTRQMANIAPFRVNATAGGRQDCVSVHPGRGGGFNVEVRTFLPQGLKIQYDSGYATRDAALSRAKALADNLGIRTFRVLD
jgi:hypothetical protein